MRPLQDQCHSTPFQDIEAMLSNGAVTLIKSIHSRHCSLHFELDTGKTVTEWFDEFEKEPVGVASLAQVHVARDRATGQKVAVKLQHPDLADFCDVDMAMVEFCLGKCALHQVSNFCNKWIMI